MPVLMNPAMENFSGNVHGGAILKLLDEVAYPCAVQYAGAYAFTLVVDQMAKLLLNCTVARPSTSASW